MSKLITFYEDILKAFSLKADSHGFISASYAGVDKPKVIKDKRLVLPIKSMLRNPDIGDMMVFHLIPEQLNQGESEIVKDLVRLANIRFSYTLTALTLNIAWMIANTENHKNLTDEQTEVMLAIGSINKTRFKTIERVLAAVSKETSSKSMVSIYLRRGGTLNGKRHSCVAVTRFPLYEELTKPGDTLYGVKVREEDRDTIQKVLEYILPDLGVKDRYNAGTHSDFMPFLESLLNVTYLLGSKLNEVTSIVDGILTDNDIDLMFNLDYYDTLTNDIGAILEEARRIPAHIERPVAPEPQLAPQVMNAPQMHQPVANPYQPQQPVYQQPVQQPSVLNSEGKVNLHAALGMNQNPYQPQQPNPFLNNFVPQNQMWGSQMGVPQPQPMFNPEHANKPWNQVFGSGVNQAPAQQYNPYMQRWI